VTLGAKLTPFLATIYKANFKNKVCDKTTIAKIIFAGSNIVKQLNQILKSNWIINKFTSHFEKMVSKLV